jgi:hypothetical protein
MRLSGRIRPIIFSFILWIGIALTLPYLAFGAARSFGGSGRIKVPRINRTFEAAHSFRSSVRFRASTLRPQNSKQSFADPFQRFGFFVVGGVSEQPVVIIQQFQPAAANAPSEPGTNRIYIAPRWIDGGYGVEVLQPGYWTDSEQAAER